MTGEERGYRRLLRLSVGGRRRLRKDVDDEVRFHLERRTERLVREGLAREEAEREARRRFGDLEAVKAAMERESGRREGRMMLMDWLDSLRQDVVFALRQLVKNPAFTAVTVLTLTLGVGATTAIFSVVDGILFRPLPFEQPDELVAVWSDVTRRGGPADEWPNFPNLWELREQSRSLDGVGIWDGGGVTLTGSGAAQQINAAFVSYDMFARVLRVEPTLGRGFSPEDDRPGAAPTVVLSYGFWTRALGGDPGVVGQTLTLDGVSNTVIGIMAEGFRPPPLLNADIWQPLRLDMTDYYCGRGGACLHALARLADGVTLAAARSEAREISRRQEEAYPDANAGVTWNLQPLQADLVADARVALLVLLGAAGLVLLIACVNEANLLLSRGSARRGELALRSAIGAGKRRIVSQLLTESTVLALAGGLVGVGAAYLLTDLLVSVAPPGTPRLEEVAVNGRVLGFAAVVTLVAGIVFGLLPALRGAGGALHDALREGGRSDPRSGGFRARQALVVTQVALALVLLVGSGLLIRSFQKLREVDLGLRPKGVVSFQVSLPGAGYPDRGTVVSFHPLMVDRLAALPGIESVGATSSLPLTGFNNDQSFTIEGRPLPPPDQSQAVWYRSVTPGFFTTMGIPLLRGRGIEPGDDASAPRVVVVNETFVRRYFPDQDPIGHRLNFNNPEDPVWWEIVGVAKDVKQFSIRGDERDALYAPFAQIPSRRMAYVLRTERDLDSLVPEIRSTLATVDPELAAAQIAPFTELVSGALASERFVTTLLGLFAVVAGALAVIGLYGVVSYNVSSRLKEMGVRLALGASAGEVRTLILRRSLVVVAVGVTLGLAATAGFTRFLETLLYGVAATDPWALLVATGLLTAAAVVASLIPARRATRVDPVEVLKSE